MDGSDTTLPLTQGIHHDMTGQGREGQDRTGQDRTGQGRTGQDRAKQNRGSGWANTWYVDGLIRLR